MQFKEAIKAFQLTHPFTEKEINGFPTRYLLCGNPDAKYTFVCLVGGTGISDVWFNHILQTEKKYRILTLDYPMEIRDLEQLADHIVKLMENLNITNPVLIGASLGGFIAQLIARRYYDKAATVVLYSTCSLSQDSISDLKKQYRFYDILLDIHGSKRYCLRPRRNRSVSKMKIRTTQPIWKTSLHGLRSIYKSI